MSCDGDQHGLTARDQNSVLVVSGKAASARGTRPLMSLSLRASVPGANDRLGGDDQPFRQLCSEARVKVIEHAGLILDAAAYVVSV